MFSVYDFLGGFSVWILLKLKSNFFSKFAILFQSSFIKSKEIWNLVLLPFQFTVWYALQGKSTTRAKAAQQSAQGPSSLLQSVVAKQMELCGASRCFTVWDPGAMPLLLSCQYVGRVLSSHVACLWSVWVGVGSSTAGSRRGVKRGAPGLVSPSSILFFFFYFFLSWRSWRRGWDCGASGGSVGHEADWRCLSLCRLLLGDGRCSASSSVCARSLRRFIFSPPSVPFCSSLDFDSRSSWLDAWA
jgi:hypothetical protein